jgi:hypothetical protein
MFKAKFLGLGVLVATLATCAPQAFANYIDAVTGSATCSTYSLQVTENDLTAGSLYQINWNLTFTPASGSPINVSSSTTFTAEQVNGVVQNLTEPLGPLTGAYTVSGSVTLQELDNPSDVGVSNPFPVDFSVTSLTCSSTPPPPTCTKTSSNLGSFNSSAISSGGAIWFNANFNATGIPRTGATVTFTNSTISFTAAGKNYNLPVPNGQITFTPSASTITTTFNSLTNTWDTTSPIAGDDEIFLTGLSWPVPAGGLQGNVKNVNWQGTFGVTPSTSNIMIQWKWGAAAYASFTSSYNNLCVKAGHNYSCGYQNSSGDHAGTCEGYDTHNTPWKNHVIPGACGYGGSNYTGTCNPSVCVQLNCGCGR